MDYPKIMICIAVKNSAKYLKRFLKEMDLLRYPKEQLRWVWMYGPSVDYTLEIIKSFHESKSYEYNIYEEPPFANKTGSSLWLADVVNAFKDLIRKDEEYVLFPDVDIGIIPPKTLQQLLKVKKDIVAPYVWCMNTNPKKFYDTYVFRVNKQLFEKGTLNGVKYDSYSPPFMNSKVPVKLDSVGTFMLIRREVFLSVDWENPVPHYQFCKNARKKGYTVWALPYLSIEHINIEIDETVKEHWPIEWYVRRGLIEGNALDKMKDDAP